MTTGTPADDRPMRELIAALANDSGELLRKEIALARIELGEAAQAVRASVAAIAVGGGIVLAGLVLVLIGAAMGLDVWIGRPWLSALIVGTSAIAIGVVTAVVGQRAAPSSTLVPERTLRSLQDDGALLQRQVGAR